MNLILCIHRPGMSSPILHLNSPEVLLASQDNTQSSREVLLSYQDRIRYWTKHKHECQSINCMTDVVNVMDLVFDCDYPEFKSGSSVMFSHRFSYLTDCKNKTILPLVDENCELMLVNDEICVVVKCYCDEEFSDHCLTINLKLMCTLVMKLIDGAYPLPPSPADLPASACVATALKNENKRDFLHNSFCNKCRIPVLLCLCTENALTKEEFMHQLVNFPLCSNCFKGNSDCSCAFYICKLYSFYRSRVSSGLVRKKLNDVKRLAYLGSCNVDMCINCGRSLKDCLCSEAYQLLYKKCLSY
ncbi:E3 protein [Turkey adenovirus 3]|uniref:E3 protein n=1 Tax=Turkey adenovirus 3 TaxID=41678 RepID=Q9YUQ5_9ADEN|nr:E3 protein [Turkey adenovirus 3]AP_000493.1 E3 [Turkey siadenovirus A]AAC64537.1 E3 protein [Turkey adenovirus 3]